MPLPCCVLIVARGRASEHPVCVGATARYNEDCKGPFVFKRVACRWGNGGSKLANTMIVQFVGSFRNRESVSPQLWHSYGKWLFGCCIWKVIVRLKLQTRMIWLHEFAEKSNFRYCRLKIKNFSLLPSITVTVSPFSFWVWSFFASHPHAMSCSLFVSQRDYKHVAPSQTHT